MSVERISEREYSLGRELRETTRSLVAMEADRDELLERLNQHECAGPSDVELADSLEASQRVIAAIHEDFDNLTTLAEGYKAQRDEARSDIVPLKERITGLEGQTQTFAPGTVPTFQFEEMTRQRDAARNAGLAESQSLKKRIETLLGVCGARLEEIETLEAVRDELRSDLDLLTEEAARDAALVQEVATDLDRATERAEAAEANFATEHDARENWIRIADERLELYLATDERLHQAIGHIDDLTGMLTGDIVALDPVRNARDIRRKYLREPTAETTPDAAIDPRARGPRPLGSRVLCPTELPMTHEAHEVPLCFCGLDKHGHSTAGPEWCIQK